MIKLNNKIEQFGQNIKKAKLHTNCDNLYICFYLFIYLFIF